MDGVDDGEVFAGHGLDRSLPASGRTMRRARHHCVDGRRLCCALRPQVGFRARSEKGLPEADVPALRGSPLSKGTEDVGVTQSFSLEFRPRYHSSKVSEAFPVREPDKKIDMIARSVGIVFALSVLLFLRPFSAQGQTTTPERKPFTPSPINACAMLASDMTTPVSDGHEKEWTRLCSLADADDCQATIEYVQSEAHKSIPGLTCHGP